MEINKIICGDALKILKEIPDNSIDAVVTDPPYGLVFMGKEWDNFGTDLQKYQEWTKEWAKEALRVLKPGGHLLSFGGTRTYHRMACGIEDAGFEIRDTIMWIYGCLSEDSKILTLNGCPALPTDLSLMVRV